MKKIAALFFLLCLCLIKTSNEQPVFLDTNSSYANEFYHLVNVSLNNITTKNVNDIFKNIKVINIYPKYNKIYKSKIKNKFYFQNGYLTDLGKFEKWYVNTISTYERNVEQLLVGIPLESMDIYISSIDYSMLKRNNMIFSKIDI